jgi:hypothetical protein
MKKNLQITADHQTVLRRRMDRLAIRNPSWGFYKTDEQRLFEYLAVQLITFLQDEELYDLLTFTDHHVTGKQEELLDAYLILDQGSEIEVKLFQFKFSKDYKGGVSTKDLYNFVSRMNGVFLRSDLQEEETLEAFAEVRRAIEEARKANRRAKRVRIQCYYVVNGQNVSHTDTVKVDQIRQYFAADRQTYGFTFETYGGLDFYNLITQGRVPIAEEALEILTERSPEPYLLHDIGENPRGLPLKVIVGFVNVNQLTKLVDRYSNNELFELNVRYFLGTGKEVNRSIIQTVTSDQSPWFGFMNNGVSITADEVTVEGPRSGGKLRISLTNMQIINGCQTVNALYHAKYDKDLKDKFQGNTSVMVRIYEVGTGNREFLDKLIIATNSQNAIRPQDLVANDPVQKTLQSLFAIYGIGYERKDGEDLPGVGYKSVFSKEDAAMCYIGVIEGQPSKLRNSLSIRELFARGEDYDRVFKLSGEIQGDESAADVLITEVFVPEKPARTRALQMFTAWAMRETCKTRIAAAKDKSKKGALRKGTYFIARLVYLSRQDFIDDLISRHAEQEASPDAIKIIREQIEEKLGRFYGPAEEHFFKSRKEFIEKNGGNEDSALKNMAFVKELEQGWPAVAGSEDLFLDAKNSGSQTS